MRRHNIIFGNFFILSTIAFALAAPVPVQEKRDECVDMVRLPKDEITVLGKRGGKEEELQELMDGLDRYFMLPPKQAGSSDTHALASSAQAGPSHGSMVGVQAPDKNRRPSSLDPNSPSFFPSQPEHPKLQSSNEFGQASEEQVAHMQWPDPRPYETMLPTQPGSAYGVVTAPSRYLGWQEGHVQHPEPEHYDPWPSLPTKPGNVATAPSTGVWSQKAHVQPEQPNPRPWNTGPSNPTPPTGPGYGVATEPSTGVWSQKAHVQPEQPNPRPWNTGPSNPTPPTGPGYGVATAPSTGVWLPKVGVQQLTTGVWIPKDQVRRPKPRPWKQLPSDSALQIGSKYRVLTAPLPDPRRPNLIDNYRYVAAYRAKDQAPGPSNPSLKTGPGHGAVTESSSDPRLPDVLDFERHIYGANYRAEDKAPGSSNPSLPTGPGHGAVAAPSPDLGLPDVADFEGHLYGANYPAKDKTKESRRHFPSTARDGGDAAQREWQSV